jgi:hypothetical protein
VILAKLSQALRQQNWAAVVIEVFVVVVGVLFALQVNNWNDARKERNLEQVYLARLSADLQGDVEGFKRLRSTFQEKYAFIEEIRSGVTQDQLSRDPRSWVERLRYSLFVSLPSVRSATFDELAGSGQLAIIQDLELRSELANYYAEYALMSQILAQPIGNYKLLVYQSFPGSLLYEWRTTESVTSEQEVLAGYQALIDQPGLEGALNAEAAYAGDLVLYCDEFIGLGEELRALIAANVR